MDDSSNFKYMGKPIQLLAGTRKRYGPAPRFASPDLLRALWHIERRTGRARLASTLSVGEGSMRTILARLSSLGLVDSAPMGHKLTKKGFSCLRRLKRKAAAFARLQPSALTFSLPALAMHIRHATPKLKPVQLRDEAVRAGASGCTILKFEGGRLIVPPFHARTHSQYAKELVDAEGEFRFAEGDLLLVAYGGDEATRERALWQIFSKL